MMEDYLLPRPLPDRMKDKFLKNTLKLGEYLRFEGFIVSIPQEWVFRNALWNSLSPYIGDFSIRGITPFPEKNYPVLLLVIPHWLNLRFSFGAVEGKIYEFSQFSNFEGRFMLVDRVEKMRLEKYMLSEKPSLNGRKIYNIFDLSFPEASRDIMLSFFLSSSIYAGRIGGCTVSMINSMSRYYASNFKNVINLIKELSPILTKNSVKIELEYEEPIKTIIKSGWKIKYQSMLAQKASIFYRNRKGREWEKSAVTQASIKMDSLIGTAELPFIPYKEELQFDYSEVKEYSLDIASYVLHHHIKMPEIDMEGIVPWKEKLIEKLDYEFPLLSEAMKMGVVMDLADVNGFGEHVARLFNSWGRIEKENPWEDVLRIYITLFERIEDTMQDRLKREISAIGERKRFERIINRVLWELNILRPEGWNFFQFQKKLEERGIDKNAEKIIQELLNEGVLRKKNENLFLAVSQV